MINSLLTNLQVARHPDAVSVVTGIVGCAGLKVSPLSWIVNSMILCTHNNAKFGIFSVWNCWELGRFTVILSNYLLSMNTKVKTDMHKIIQLTILVFFL